MLIDILKEPEFLLVYLPMIQSGVIEIFKRLFNIKDKDKKVLPAISILIGWFLVLCMDGFILSVSGFFMGIALGLSACGFFDFSKSFIEVFKKVFYKIKK